MNRLPVSIVFQNENTRPLRVVGIVFDNDRLGQTVDDVTNEDTVCREFVITVLGYANGAASHQRAYLLQGLAQFPDPVSFLIILSGVRLGPANSLWSRPERLARGLQTPRSSLRHLLCATSVG